MVGRVETTLSKLSATVAAPAGHFIANNAPLASPNAGFASASEQNP